MMLFSMVASTTFVSATEVYPKEYNTEGTITFEAGDEVLLLLIQRILIPINLSIHQILQALEQEGHYRLIMDQNSNLGLKNFYCG